MKQPVMRQAPACALVFSALLAGCGQPVTDLRIKKMDSAQTAKIAAAIEAEVKPVLAEGLTMQLWGIDSLVVSPIAIDIDDNGSIYYTTTNRQKNSEFDIRGHREWEIPSISLATVEDRRKFLHEELSPENSHRNKWLADLNGDSSHDWRDLAIETEHVYRLDDTDGDGRADRSQLVVDDFHDEVTDVAGGVLADGNDLYVAVAPDLWKMRDKNGDGIADEKTSLSHGYAVHIGFSGHGMSGVEMGPDGRIYWQIGDIGFNGTDKTGKKWEFPNCGVIARSNPDGSDFEIFAHGLRNTHEFVFDEYGNLISEDNDGDHPGEKERLVYVVNGADAGWRSNWQYGKYRDPQNNAYKVWMEEKMYLPRWDGQAAYIVPPVANFVSGPAGMVYNPGTALGPEYNHTFFIAEFVGNPSGSGIHSFRLKPSGAGFELGDQKKVLGGILATGLDFGPDGALYVADWIDGWDTHNYGRIWKLDRAGAAEDAARKEVKALLASSFTDKKPEELGKYLQHADYRVRLKAQFELVGRGKAGKKVLEAALQQTSHQLARVHAIQGLSQMGRKNPDDAAALVHALRERDPEIRALAAKWLGDIKRKTAAPFIVPLLKDTSSRVRFFAAEALGRMKFAPAIPGIIAMLEANNEQDVYLRHAGALALARIGDPAPVAALAAHPSRALRIAAVVALRRMKSPEIARFLQDADEFVVTEAARAINDDNSIPAAMPALGALLGSTTFSNEPLIRRAINACLQTGIDSLLQTLIAYATNTSNPAAMRAEAVAALGVWPNPSVLDRVDGWPKGPKKRDDQKVVAASTQSLMQLLTDKDNGVKTSAALALEKLKIAAAAPALLAAVKTDGSPEVRIAALKALVTLQAPELETALRTALTDKEKNVRVAGLDLLDRMKIPQATMSALLADVIATKTLEEKQAAILALGKLQPEYSSAPLRKLLDQMAAGSLSPGVLLELGEAIDSSGAKDLADRYKSISAKRAPDEGIALYAGSLEGGDPHRGQRIFFRNENAQCMKCHSYDDRGGNAGPRLNGVGARLSRQQLLEALINPSARLAPGFGMVVLELKDGKKIAGVLQGESRAGLKVKVGSGPEQLIAAADIVKKTYSPSSMPDMKTVLSKKEIRDLVSFLSSAKTEE
ncbi:PVC-type heme-binding CxxCH protein [Chitinophaga rhizosphaerae]|uniref:PVC-type heme-binding CxxCH protein n=1 Tax=Chitinophaga rhizosphaerae TaxID=1864947 RepID=UPI000F805742|nr:PVC-type heme-binding CxxCH protein [Chitinophaga rhizosphaerae]